MTSGQTEVARWNAAHPVGTNVVVSRGNGSVLATTTTCRAFRVPNSDEAAIRVKGVSGWYLLSRITAVPKEKP